MKTTHNFCSLNLTAICLLATAMAGLVLTTAARAAQEPGPWPTERANAWYAQQPWLVGCNFLPSTAVNDVEMWQADSFDAATIERELGWARDLGFNSVRVFLNFVVWEADADGLKQRFDRFLAIADNVASARCRCSWTTAILPAASPPSVAARPRARRPQQPVGIEPAAGDGHRPNRLAAARTLRERLRRRVCQRPARGGLGPV